jgi:hypothetical protein
LTAPYPGRAYLRVDERMLLRIADLAHDPELQALGVRKSSDKWALLTAKVVHSEADLVDKLSPVIAALLRKLDQVQAPVLAKLPKRSVRRP